MKNKSQNLKSVIIFCAALCISLNTFGQTFTYNWAYNMTNKGLRLEKDPFGYVIALNSPSSGSGWELAKYNSSGTSTFSVAAAGPPSIILQAFELKIDKYGYVYVLAGLSTSTVGYTFDVDPGPGVTTIGNGLSFIKYTNNFVPIWAKTIDVNFPSTKYDASMTIDSIGKVYLTGTFNGVVDFDPSAAVNSLTATIGSANDAAFIAKYDSTGNYIWAKSMGGKNSDKSRMVEVSPVNGDVFFEVGFNGDAFGEMADIDPGPGVINVVTHFGSGSHEYYFIRFDANGNFMNYNHPSPQVVVQESTIDSQGNLYVYYNNSGFSVRKYNSSWTTLFTAFIGGSSSYRIGDICIDGNFNLYTLQMESSNCSNNANLEVNKINATSGAIIQSMNLSGVSANACGFQPGGIVSITGNEVIISNDHNISPTYTIDYHNGPSTVYLPSQWNTKGAIAKYNFCITAPTVPGAISGNTSVCPSTTNMYSITPVTGATSYTWTNSSGWTGVNTTNTINLTSNAMSTTISVSAVNGCGASATSTFVASIGMPSVTAVSSSSAICSGSSSTLNASGASSYTWQPGNMTGSNIVVSPASNTTYTVLGSSGGTCTNTAMTSINVNTTPTISVNSGSICSGSSFTMTPSGASTYTFSSGSSVISPTANASYSVTGTSSAGCIGSNTAVASVTVNSVPLITVNSGSICSGSSFTIMPSGASTYTIQGGSSIVSPSSNATYTVSGTSSAGCVATSAVTSSVTVVSTPTANAGTSQTITCASATVSLSGSGVSTYSWSGPGIISGSNTASPIVNISGTYSLAGSTSGCNSNTSTVNVLTNTIVPTVSAASNSSLICGPPFQGTSTLTATGSASTYSWMPSGSGASISVSPSVTTTYTVIATGSNGCTNMATVTQNVSMCTGVSTTLNDQSELIIYPNPTSGVVSIKAKAGLQIHVYNIIGELILKTELKTDTAEIDLSNQANGIYFIRIGSVTKKIIKE